MHLPDGYLDARVWIPLTAAAGAATAPCLAALDRPGSARALPRLGMTAAYLFAAQMINFPVLPGVSGHLLGGALAAILLGPAAATVVIACVLLVQALFFQDGGLTALGANQFNMGIVGAWGGYAIYRATGGWGPPMAAALAAWGAVMLGALAMAIELALSGVAAAGPLLRLVLAIHAAIGLAEAALTAAAVGVLLRVRPDLLPLGGSWRWWPVAGAIALLLVAPFASPLPDGLEAVAERLGFAGRARDSAIAAVAPDYALPGLPGGPWSVVGAGALGTLFALVVGQGVARLARRRSAPAGVRLDPRVRLACSVAITLSAALLPGGELLRLLALGLMAAIWATLNGTPLRWVLTRLAAMLPFAAPIAVVAATAPDGEVRAAGLALKAWSALLAMGAFAATTPEPEAYGTLRWFRIPAALVQAIAFSLRYLRVLEVEAGRMLRARAARGGGGSLAGRAYVAGAIAGSLFVRSYDRAERVVLAMEARGYRGPDWATDRRRWRLADLACLVLCLLLLGGILLQR